MMKRIGLLLLTALVLASCASSDDDSEPQYPQRGGGRRTPGGFGGEEVRDRAGDAGLLGLLPPANWWRDPQISTAVKLSDSQFTALDAIGKDHASEIDRLRMDSIAAERDLRLLLAADKPTAGDIVTAGQRVKSDRDQMLDHELKMLADERALLTHEQWAALQDAMRGQRQDFRRERGGFGPGGGMGRRGGGRRPGF